jgi:uncharacterized membrane protein
MNTNSSKFASQFAPYTPPPDDPSSIATTSKPSVRPWFPVHTSSLNNDTSYQSGGIPTFNTSAAGGARAAEEAEGNANQWETRYGMRVDVLAATAYVLGPITALVLLIMETQNDYVRFHAYQSALLLTPLYIVRIFASLLGFWSWLRTFLTLSIILLELYMAFQAYRDAAHNGLSRFQLPTIGQIADDWVADE